MIYFIVTQPSLLLISVCVLEIRRAQNASILLVFPTSHGKKYRVVGHTFLLGRAYEEFNYRKL